MCLLVRLLSRDRYDRSVELRVPGYHVPGCGICLLPPQYLTYYSSSRNLGESRDKAASYPWLCQHTPSFPVSLLALLSTHPDSHPVGPVKSFACSSFIASGGLSRYCIAERRSAVSGTLCCDAILLVSCAPNPVTIMDDKCLWLIPTAIGFAITSWFFKHPWTCYGRLILVSIRLTSDWVHHCPP